MRFVTHLESALDGTRFDADQEQTMHAGRPLWVRYDLAGIRSAWRKKPPAERPPGMWRYRELLPTGTAIEPVTLHKSSSPIIDCPRLGATLGLQRLQVKDESQLTTASFKGRGLSMAVTMARHFGRHRLAMASNGNAAVALAVYTARAGMEAMVVMPDDSNPGSIFDCWVAGARMFLANGLIDQCGKIVRAGHDAGLWFDVSTLKEPYRLEGKKTMGLEIADQLQGELPDAIVYPTGGGTALVGMWKAFCELREMGWLRSSVMPRMIAVQSNGCSPIVRAFEQGERFATRVEGAHTCAYGIRVPQALGDFMILDALRESQGAAIAAEESELPTAQRLGCSKEGISFGLEPSACLAAIPELLQRGWLDPRERVLVVNTSAANKYWTKSLPRLPQLDLNQSLDPRQLLDPRD